MGHWGPATFLQVAFAELCLIFRPEMPSEAGAVCHPKGIDSYLEFRCHDEYC